MFLFQVCLIKKKHHKLLTFTKPFDLAAVNCCFLLLLLPIMASLKQSLAVAGGLVGNIAFVVN